MSEQMFIMLFAIMVDALVALVGKNRKIGYGWTFVICLFLGPLIGLIVALCSKRKDSKEFTSMD